MSGFNKILLFLNILVLAFIVMVAIVYAWTNPSGNPTSGGGALYYSGGNVGIGTTGPGYKLDVNGAVNIPVNTWITAGGNSLIRDSYYGYSATYRVAHIGGTLAGTRGIAIGIDPTSITGGAFTGNEIAFPNTVEFMQANSGGTDWLQNVLALNNGNVGIGTTGPGYTLTVNGTAWVTSGAWSGSDIRWKKDITPLPPQDSLNKVIQLKPVGFNWRTDEFPDLRFSSSTQIGFIAQDVEKIIPEVVTTDNNGYKGISYERITPVLTAAIQEQQKQIEELKSEIKELKSRLK